MEQGNLEAWLILLRTPALGPAALRSAITLHGNARKALAAFRRSDISANLAEAARAWLDAPDHARINDDLDWLAQPNRHLIGWDDADYPSLLREISSAPAALFVDGDASLLWMPQVAVVGSRSASTVGLATTKRFARGLGVSGYTITSGLADGVDGAAHAAALESGARTIAVLGTGPDLVYPRKHQALAAQIAEQGALVSEFPPGTRGKAEHFPRRNRIISGLALGTLVVEAGLKSGSLITARYASEQGREVFAIPGSINNPMVRGCHQLIRDGARLVESPEEISSELSALAAELGDRLRARLDDTDLPQDDARNPNGSTPQRDAEYMRLLDAMGFEEIGLDQLAAVTGLSIAALSSMLLVLELDGAVQAASGGRYVRCAERA